MQLTRLLGKVEKGWGEEDIFVSNEYYCGKLLIFNKGAKFSMHFHKSKIETWRVISGEFIVEWIDTDDATVHQNVLKVGDVWTNESLLPHRLICLEEGTIIEVSTPDSVEDNYRVLPGDSQKINL